MDHPRCVAAELVPPFFSSHASPPTQTSTNRPAMATSGIPVARYVASAAKLLRVLQKPAHEPNDREGYDNGRIGRELAIGWIRDR